MGMSTLLTQFDRYFDLKGLSDFSSLGVSTIRGYITAGLPCYKVKGKVLIKRSEFEGWMCKFRINEAQNLKEIAEEAVKVVRESKK